MITLRDNLFITASARAVIMDYTGAISLPTGVAGEDDLATFICNNVDTYINEHIDIPFDEYIEEALINRYHKED